VSDRAKALTQAFQHILKCYHLTKTVRGQYFNKWAATSDFCFVWFV